MHRVELKTSGLVGDTRRLELIKEKHGYALHAEPASQETICGSDLWWMLYEIDRLRTLVALDLSRDWVQS
jgi:hypothetical protein